MKKYTFFAAATLLLLATASCDKKELETPDNSVREYTLEVTNDDYTATTQLTGIGDTRIAEVLNQPAWVSDVRREDKLLNGSMILAVTVKADASLEDIRSAKLSINMTNGATANLEITQRAGLPVGFNAGESPSVNTALENDWSTAQTVELVTSSYIENGITKVRTEVTPLPWNYTDPGTKHNIPDDELEKMLKFKKDWILAFNTTGIKRASCVHTNYFGLYNICTGILRVFFYWPADLIPESGANDHLWYARFKGAQAEHNSTQFAVPLNHEIKSGTAGYEMFEKKVGTFYTTAFTDQMNPTTNYVVVPKIGWWAFDVDLSAMRKDSFFKNYQQIAFGMDLFDQQNVILKSLIQGGLEGTLNGKINMSALLPASTNTAGKVVPHIATAAGSFLTNKFFLDYITSASGNAPGKLAPGLNGGDIASAPIRPHIAVSTGVGVLVALVGCLVTMAGNIGKEYGKEGGPNADMKSALGNMNANIGLTLKDVKMDTEGLIKSQRSHKVPEVRIPIEYLSNIADRNTRSGAADLEIGKGFWNISNDPVVYIVKDAYWANKPQMTYYSRKEIPWYRTGQDKAEYDISMSPTMLGMRLISFFDPTSIGDVVINESLFGTPIHTIVSASYGVYPTSAAGGTDWFREATSMDYNPLSLSTPDKDQKVSTGSVAGAVKAPFKVFKAPYNKDLFKVELSGNAHPGEVATRLSSQRFGESNTERRYYGNSLFYENENATYQTVDNVQYVTDPQIFLPFDEQRRVIMDPDIPDMVISVNLTLRSQGPMEDEPTWKTYTLRYLPKIQFIAAKDVKSIADRIVASENGGMASNVKYLSAPIHQGIIQSYSQEITTQLSK